MVEWTNVLWIRLVEVRFDWPQLRSDSPSDGLDLHHRLCRFSTNLDRYGRRKQRRRKRVRELAADVDRQRLITTA